MNKVAGYFMKAAVIYGLAGMVLGVFMGARHDFALRSVHSHLALLGWLTLSVSAFFYQIIPDASRLAAAKAHFWVANAGMIVLIVSLAFLSRGVAAADPGAAAGSVISLAAFAIFAFVVFRTAHERSE